MSQNRDLWKFSYAWASFQDVKRYAERALEHFAGHSIVIDDLLLKSLTYSIITTYALPFKQKGLLRLEKGCVPPEYLECHNMLVALRDKVIVHHDPITPITNFGYLNQVRVTYHDQSNWCFATVHPRLTQEKTQEIILLAQALQDRCRDRIEAAFSIILEDTELKPGKYLIEPKVVQDEMEYMIIPLSGNGD